MTAPRTMIVDVHATTWGASAARERPRAAALAT